MTLSPVSAQVFGRRWLAGAVAVCAIGSGFCPAYEVRFADTGYQPTSGMSLAIHYEIKQLIARHEQLFKRKAPEEFGITYRIFPTREAFETHAAAAGHKVTSGTLGYTRTSWLLARRGRVTSIRVQADVVSWQHDQPAVHLSTILHETTHAVTHAFLRHVPLWMMEGSADWFGRPVWANSDVQKAEQARRWQTLKQQLDRKQLPPLKAFLETETYEDWNQMFGGHIGHGYVIGYSLFDFFMAQPEAQRFLAALVTAPASESGSSPAKDFAARLDQFWRGGLAGFERSWHEWIRSKAATEKVPPPRKK